MRVQIDRLKNRYRTGSPTRAPATRPRGVKTSALEVGNLAIEFAVIVAIVVVGYLLYLYSDRTPAEDEFVRDTGAGVTAIGIATLLAWRFSVETA